MSGGCALDPIIPDGRGNITVKQAAALCGVAEVTVRNWINRGWHDADGNVCKLAVEYRFKGLIMLDPVKVARADQATAAKARRVPACATAA